MAIALSPDDPGPSISALTCLHLLATPLAVRLDRIVQLAARWFAVPTAMLTLITETVHLTVAAAGPAMAALSHDCALCTATLAAPDPLIVADLAADPRFSAHPLVHGPPFLRFYAGVPLQSADGVVVGMFCLLDTTPHAFTALQRADLQSLAGWAERELTTDQLTTALLRQQEFEDALRLSEARSTALLASLVEGIIVQDAQSRITLCNPSAERMLGRSLDQMRGMTNTDPHWDPIHEDGSPFAATDHPSVQALTTGQPQHDVVMGIRKPDGSLTWLVINSQPLIQVGSTHPVGVVSSFIDITRHKQHEHALSQQNAVLTVLATTDGLTGVMNKRTLLAQLAQAVDDAQRTHRPVSVIMVDVDHFKQYNDTYGHPAGDSLLIHIAQTLQGCCRGEDVVARYGGEEFLLLLPTTDAAGAVRVAERCRRTIAQQSLHPHAITASFGVTTLEEGTWSVTDLISHADQALYQSKHMGRNRITVMPLPPHNPA